IVYIASTNGFFYAVSSGGTRLWQQEVSFGEQLASSPALEGGRVITGSIDGSVYAFDAGTGAAEWSFSTDAPVVSSPAIGRDGTVYVGSLDGNLYALSPAGAERWRVATGGGVVSSPAIDADGVVYVGSLSGEL